MPTRVRRVKPETVRTRLPRNPVQVVTRSMDSIYPYEDNPRINEPAVESVRNSIEQFGFLVPLVIDADGTIVTGHTRYEAAKRLGYTDAPCIIASHLNEDQIRAFRLIDNKVAELAKWDTDLLAAEISLLRESGIEFTQFGWTQEEIDCLGEIVAEDCMSAGAAAALDQDVRPSAREGQRAPLRTRLVIGEFVIFIDQNVYRRWANEVRAGNDYVESRIETDLKDRLGIIPYERAQ